MTEYLAMGKPVVSTDLEEVRRFNREHGDVVRVASDAAAFAAAIRAEAAPASAAVVARRIEVAKANGWDRRVQAMIGLVDEAAAAKNSGERGWEDRLRRLYAIAAAPAQGVLALVLACVLCSDAAAVVVASPLRVARCRNRRTRSSCSPAASAKSSKAGGGFTERVMQAVALHRAGLAKHLVFSSGYVFTSREAELMRAVAVDNGVPADAIVLEESAKNTYENVELTRRILKDHGWRRILLVSSPYHMRRATLTWRQVAPEIEVVPTPVPESQFYAHTRGASLEQIRGILHEYAALVSYWWKDWI